MICRKCGTPIEPDSLFCTKCGARADVIVPPETAAEIAHESEYMPEEERRAWEEHFHDADSESMTPVQTYDELPIPRGSTITAADTERPLPSAQPKSGQSEESGEKTFFGVGAFILCVTVIGLLSVTSGVFAALYFHAIGG